MTKSKPKSKPKRGRSGKAPRIGAHMSISGGVHLAFQRAVQAGCEALQIFVKSSNQWRARKLGQEEVREFHAAARATGIPLIAHVSYLINLASPDPVLWPKSISSLIGQLERCEVLGVPRIVIHPGSHMGAGAEAGIARIARGLDEVLRETQRGGVRILLENTAGQGTSVGWRFEQIGAILQRAEAPERLGVCLDTCHAFAAGYDLRSVRGYQRTISQLKGEVGLQRLEAIHLNDSKRELGSRVDRHQHIGEGHLGLDAFRLIVNDSRMADLPMILETPKGPDLTDDVKNLGRLRSLVGRKTTASGPVA